jgi:hypothetical protein
MQMQLNMKHTSAELVSKWSKLMPLHSWQSNKWRGTGDGDDPLWGHQEVCTLNLISTKSYRTGLNAPSSKCY